MKPYALAIRIYHDSTKTSMADIKMNDGVVEHIEWTNIKQREQFMKYINGYTLIYDEREKVSFSEV
ncbi:hypothetical protein [Anaerovorax sp. IOR16]|uniref:hypothetical protein n=1 Tax=Anaerovorax sp. IOR16 TaxID=2773458 RepID=UPI0019D232BD|nr:hypothetical protein [Anaerovorax sp. IOR16]